MKKGHIYILLCAVILVGCGNESTQVENEVPVETATAHNSKALDFYGQISVPNKIDINIGFPIVINSIYVKEGQVVNKGEKLFSFDDSAYQAEIKQQEKKIEVLEAQLKKIQTANDATSIELVAKEQELALQKKYLNEDTNPDISVLKASLAIEEKTLSQLKDKYSLNQELYDAGSVPLKDLQAIETEINNVEQGILKIKTNMQQIIENKQIEVSRLETTIQTLKATIVENENKKISEAEVANKELESARLVLSNLKGKLDSPYIQGNDVICVTDTMVIDHINFNTGSCVQNMGQTIITGFNPNEKVAIIEIAPEEISNVQVGTQVTLKIEESDIEAKGTVKYIPKKSEIIDGKSILKVEISIDENIEAFHLNDQIEVTID